jgi:hypothetical protein
MATRTLVRFQARQQDGSILTPETTFTVIYQVTTTEGYQLERSYEVLLSALSAATRQAFTTLQSGLDAQVNAAAPVTAGK